MSEEKQENQQQVDDPIKNLKAEMARKQDNTNKELENIKNMLAGMAQSQQQQMQRATKQTEVEVPDPLLDPVKYEEYITNKVSAKMDQSINQNNQRQNQLAALVQNYPELQDANADLTKKAVEVYNRLSQEEKMSPNAYKFAVQDAAAELGVVAMSKRKQSESSDEDFTGNSDNYQSNNSKSKQNRQKADKIDDATLALAELMGRPVKDPKYLESLKKYTGRKNWNKGE